MHGAERSLLNAEPHLNRARPRLGDMGLDQRSAVGVHHEDDAPEAGGDGIAGQQVDDGLTVGTDGGEWLHATEAPGPPCGEDDQRGPAHRDHRSTALAQVIPAPKPVSSMVSPFETRPESMASTSASGIDADEVLP